MPNAILNEIASTTDAESVAGYLRANTPQLHQLLQVQRHQQSITSVRRSTYRGHEIVIRTTYQIEVDGQEITGHVTVGNDGRVHYHPVPNQTFNSAVTMVKRIIDLFPHDFPDGEPESHNHAGA